MVAPTRAGVPGTSSLERFDAKAPVRTMPALDDYLRVDVIPLLSEQRERFERVLAFVGALTLVYGLYGIFVVARR
jgi:hypothetical protein